MQQPLRTRVEAPGLTPPAQLPAKVETAAITIGDVALPLIPALEDCDPGLKPVEYNVLVAPAREPEKKGGLILPDEVKERMALAYQVGRVVAASPLAFNFDRWPDEAEMPKRGDIVWYARYAGTLVIGRDGKTYRLIKDKDIGAIFQPPEDPDPEEER
jgi:co-chaperonin GroES (HSP10)